MASSPRPGRIALTAAALALSSAPFLASAGEDCTAPTPLSLPAQVSDDTTGARDDLRTPCTGSSTAGPDHVYELTVAAAELVDVILTPRAADYDASLYLLSDCGALTCAGGADDHGMGTAELLEFVALAAGSRTFVVVDGFPFFSSEDHGPYDLEVRRSLLPDDCATARVVPGIPWREALDTTLGSDSPGLAAGCPLAPASGPDLVYRLDPTFTGRVAVTLEPTGFDASLYALDDCAARTCLGSSDQPGPGVAESMDLTVTAAVPVHVVVDGMSAGGGYQLTFLAGESCADPIAAGAFPFTARGDAGVAANDLDLSGRACTGFRTNGADVVYDLTVLRDALVDLTARPLDGAYDLALYLVTDCAAPDATCVAGADAGNDGAAETIAGLYLLPGQPLHAVIDSATFEAAPYELTITSHPGARLFAVRRGADVELRFAGDQPTYAVERDLDPGFGAPLILAPAESGPTFTDTTAGAGSYFYRVR